MLYLSHRPSPPSMHKMGMGSLRAVARPPAPCSRLSDHDDDRPQQCYVTVHAMSTNITTVGPERQKRNTSAIDDAIPMEEAIGDGDGVINVMVKTWYCTVTCTLWFLQMVNCFSRLSH